MSQIDETRRAKPGRHARHALRVDLTPMVDLGFLLITFFILTTALREPTITDLYMPKDEGTTEVAKSTVLNVILNAADSIDYFNGDDSINTFHTTFGGIRRIIQQKQKAVAENSGSRKKMILIIKPTSFCRYQNLIDILDEVQICDVGTYYLKKD